MYRNNQSAARGEKLKEAAVNLVFMGSSDFSLRTLKNLAKIYTIRGVVTQPDRPSGRRRKLYPSQVKSFTCEMGLEIFQPDNLREHQSIVKLRDWHPDLIIVVAYGQILSQEILDLPEYGCINIHASLLPRWRGASPIQAAILHGDEVTGVTIMKMDSGLDTGPIIADRKEPVLPSDTARTLSDRLAKIGADLLIEVLPRYIKGHIIPQPQDNKNATYAEKYTREDGLLDFNHPAEYLVNQVAAFNPWPGAYLMCEKIHIKVQKAHIVEDLSAVVGQRVVREKKPAVGTSSGWLVLDEVQPESRKPMSGEAFLAGAHYW